MSARPRAVSSGLSTGSYMVDTNNGGCLEQVPGFNAARVMAQGFGSRRLPERLCAETLGAADWLEFAFPQAIIGKDDRVPIGDTTRLPWRCICHLVADGLHDQQVLGTGWMAGPRTVLTAGHNIFSHKLGREASRISVVPGRQVDVAPFDFFRSSRFDVHPRWRSAGDENFDLGVIWLNEAVGERVGWFGFGSRTDSSLQDLLVNTSGYPADKRMGTQWFNAGRISDIRPRVLQYGLDTEAGQSGSPIFTASPEGDRTVIAVHAYGGDPVNRGIRITDDVHELFRQWVR